MRTEFEKNRYWIGLYRTDVDFDKDLGEFGRYISNGSREIDDVYLDDFNARWEAYANAWCHQQMKIDALQHQIEEMYKLSQESALQGGIL